MPGQNGTGPLGQGPRSGDGQGRCGRRAAGTAGTTGMAGTAGKAGMTSGGVCVRGQGAAGGRGLGGGGRGGVFVEPGASQVETRDSLENYLAWLDSEIRRTRAKLESLG